MSTKTKTKKPVRKTWSAAALLRELQFVTKERDKLQRDFDSFKAVHDVLVDDARRGIGLNGVSFSRETQQLRERIRDLESALENANDRAQSNLKKYLELKNAPLEKAHAELQKFYAQSQDELHACRERELMRPWWKKLLGLR